MEFEIWNLSRTLVIDIHSMTLALPKFEQFEEAQQIRRSMKSVKSNIVEGYGRRMYKQEFLRFLVFAIASRDETIDHLETLYETKSLSNEILYTDLHERLEVLGKKLHNFFVSVSENHVSKK